MENGVAPRCIAAVSTRLNSGRLVIINATVSPRPTPSAASPPAIRRTRSAYSAQLISIPPPGVLSATASGLSAAVIWNAPQSVEASNERGSAPVPMLAPPSVSSSLTFAIGQVSHLLTMQL
jgi:hypothetical protein